MIAGVSFAAEPVAAPATSAPAVEKAAPARFIKSTITRTTAKKEAKVEAAFLTPAAAAASNGSSKTKSY